MAGVPGMHERLSTSPVYAAKVRARIKAGGIVYVLQKHILGEREMTSSQVSAALGLLRKVVPDIGHMEVTGANGGNIKVEDVTDLEAARFVAFAMAEGAETVKRAQASGNAAAKTVKEKA